MALITTADKNKLYTQVKHELGFPLRPFEIKDDMMDSYLEMVIEDYSSLVNSWLIQQQWVGLENMNLSNGDFISAFTTKSNDYMESFTRSFSKQVGLGSNAPATNEYHLKRDYIILSGGVQHYVIPAHRQINEVLWITPPEINLGLVDPFAIAGSLNAGMLGWNMYGRNMQAVQPIYSTLLAAQDRRMKQRVLQSTLSYRISGLGLSGEKLLHLYPVPGSSNEITNFYQSKNFAGRMIFYWYYDTSKTNADKCLEENDDIVRLPSDVPIDILRWEKMNSVSKQQIRNLLIAKVKIVIGGVRGFNSGTISVTDKELTLDYRHLLDEGIKLKEETEKNITDQLEKLRQVNLTDERNKISQNLNEFLSKQPHMYPIITI